MNRNVNSPYTYIVKFIPTNQVYYGVRYSKHISENELFQSYFTSSKIIKQLIDYYGVESFEWSVRKTFANSKDARRWESKVLRRMNADKSDKFLNLSLGQMNINEDYIPYTLGKKCYYNHLTNEYVFSSYKLTDPWILKGYPKPEEMKRKLSEYHKNRKKSEEHQNKINDSLRKFIKENVKGKTYEELYGEEKAKEVKLKISNSNKGNEPILKGLTYEEAYGEEKAKKLKLIRSAFLKENNPGLKMKGKTYEELYGEEKAKELKLSRSKSGPKRRKTYIIIDPEGNVAYRGSREGIKDACVHLNIKPSPLYANKEYKGFTLEVIKENN